MFKIIARLLHSLGSEPMSVHFAFWELIFVYFLLPLLLILNIRVSVKSGLLLLTQPPLDVYFEVLLQLPCEVQWSVSQRKFNRKHLWYTLGFPAETYRRLLVCYFSPVHRELSVGQNHFLVVHYLCKVWFWWVLPLILLSHFCEQILHMTLQVIWVEFRP